MVHFEDECVKLTTKAKALDKPFGDKLVNPFLKWYNGKRAAEAHLSVDDLEEVTLGQREPVSLSASVRSVVGAAGSSPAPLRVDLIRRKERLLCFRLAGIMLPMTCKVKFVDAPLSLYALPEFLRTVNQQYGVDLAMGDVAQVRRCDVSDASAAQVDLSAPAFRVLPRLGTLDIQVVLLPSAAKRTLDRLPQLPDEQRKEAIGEDEPAASADHGVFRVRCAEVELKLTLTPKLLGQSLREAVVLPFLKAYAKRTGGALLDADAVVSISVDGLETSDATKASSFALGNVVRVELALKDDQSAAATTAPPAVELA